MSKVVAYIELVEELAKRVSDVHAGLSARERTQVRESAAKAIALLEPMAGAPKRASKKQAAASEASPSPTAAPASKGKSGPRAKKAKNPDQSPAARSDAATASSSEAPGSA